MTAGVTFPANPFPGPIPLRNTDPIFGREREIAELVDRLIADRLVMLYSPSGAGKSSMLNASGGVQPKMREREFRTHNTIRVGMAAPQGVNRYVWSCATSLEIQYRTPARLTEILGEPANDLFVFDQFEEVLTAQPGDEVNRLEFFKQLGEALRVQGRWAVFAIREDYLAPVDEYLEWLPTHLASRMRIDILAAKAARKAILEPIEAAGTVTFEDGALDAMLLDLAPDNWVEPVQLQVVCKDLWDELVRQKLTTITKDLLKTSGSAELALEKYFGNVVRDLAAGEVASKPGVSERNIRDWFEKSLISESNTRLQVIQGKSNTGTLPTTVVNELERAHLIRSDVRRSDTWCELTHDRLIRPVTQSNKAWKAANLSLLQRETELWVKNGSSPDRLLRGKSLSEADRWARQHSSDLTPGEKEYLARSNAARRKRTVAIVASVGLFALITNAYFGAEQARLESHHEVVKGIAERVVLYSADQPMLAASLALTAEQRHLSGRGLLGRLFDVTLWKGRAGEEEQFVRAAYLSATVEHDPRFIEMSGRGPTDSPFTCIWYTHTGPAVGLGGTNNGCPGQFLVQKLYHTLADIKPAWRFDGPPGWSIANVQDKPDVIELHAPAGHIPAVYPANPGAGADRFVVDRTESRAAWTVRDSSFVYVMDLETRAIVSLPTGDQFPGPVQFSPDGKILAAGCPDFSIRLWYFPSGGTWDSPIEGKPLRGHADSIVDLAFSDNGRELASISNDGWICRWRTLPELAPLATREFYPAALAPGVRIAYTTAPHRDLSVRALGNSGGPPGPEKILATDVRCAGLRRDGKTAAIASKADQPFFKVIDLETGTSLGKGKHEGITAVALSDDGKYAASASTGGVVVWSLQNSAGPEGVFGVKQTLDYNDRRHVMTEHTFPGDSVANSLAFLPDGQTLAAGNSNRTIWFWNFAGSKAGEAVITVRDAIVGLAFTPDGELGASLDKLHGIRFWDRQHKPMGGMLQLAGSPRAIAFGADSKSFHVWMEGGLPLSWNIDIPHMREEACRLAGEQSVDSLCPVQAARRAAAREADRKEADLKQPNRKEGIKR